MRGLCFKRLQARPQHRGGEQRYQSSGRGYWRRHGFGDPVRHRAVNGCTSPAPANNNQGRNIAAGLVEEFRCPLPSAMKAYPDSALWRVVQAGDLGDGEALGGEREGLTLPRG